MAIATGTFVDGKVVLEDGSFPEGTRVTVVASESSEIFDLSPSERDELRAAIEEAERGETISAQELLDGLPG